MRSGLLWFDNKNELPVALAQAAARYAEKFGVRPDTCFVNPNDAPDGLAAIDGITIRAKSTIIPKHLWLGVANPTPPQTL